MVLSSHCCTAFPPTTNTVAQNSKSLRRLAADHASLHTAGLPPNYLFPPGADDTADLTSLTVLLAGPVGTPYASGVWRLHLAMPPTYPAAPPTARFLTRLWHPNIDEATGAVCVETLKRDWSPQLKLRDVLVTISCLLIQPNPASALNEAAGKLAVEDWDGYCRRARLMAGIHAEVPRDLVDAVREAQGRGEEVQVQVQVEVDKDKEQAQQGVKSHSKGKAKERVKGTPARVPKLQRPASEDEENRRRRGGSGSGHGDPEEDWIPGPGDETARGHARTRSRGNNAFGIKGLRRLDTPPPPAKRVFGGTHTPTPTSPIPNPLERGEGGKGSGDEEENKADPFITVASRRGGHGVQVGATEMITATTATDTKLAGDAETNGATRDALKFSHQNSFSTIQLNNQTHALFEEFSCAWEDAMVLHDAGVGGGGGGVAGTTKADVRKRLAGGEFDKKKKWEMKRFKRAGCDLKRFNRADWGVRTGVARL
ncbi:ubiquitin-conjugating enzyme E2 S [Alternaria panax]|uniref:Ubiquitin-conjugating enzyme E2 S n=1 Tax=Alternaria panax TaxID=48097 RepID=A0AAD4FBT3_9PLEO|nr:ubiquitin-conjugating enzyme E2 S [Alternaria panax]